MVRLTFVAKLVKMKLRIATIGLMLTMWCAPAFTQCAMCYASAAGANKQGQKAINKAVVVLLIPPLSFMTLGVGMAVRYSRKRDEERDREEA